MRMLTPQQAAVTEAWAVWLDETATQDDEMTDGERSGFRVAATHLRAPLVQERIANAAPPARESARDVLVDALVQALYDQRGGESWDPEDDVRHDELLHDATRIADEVLARDGSERAS